MRRPLTTAVVFAGLTGAAFAQDTQSFDRIERGLRLRTLANPQRSHHRLGDQQRRGRIAAALHLGDGGHHLGQDGSVLEHQGGGPQCGIVHRRVRVAGDVGADPVEDHRQFEPGQPAQIEFELVERQRLALGLQPVVE